MTSHESSACITTRATADRVTPVLSHPLILLLACCAGLAVACLYYSQPMLGVLGAELNASVRSTGWIPTLTQLGYAAGILLLAPLGDRHDRRKIMLVKAVSLMLALLLAGMAQSVSLLLPASLLIGLTATLAQDIVPAAASLAHDNERGKVVGTVMTGLLSGILLSRVISGFVAEHFGWRSMFYIATLSILVCAIAIYRFVPRFHPATNLSYLALLKSLGSLWGRYTTLRRAALSQGLLSVGFSAFWSTLAVMLHGEPFHLGSAVAGSFGLAGAAGALAAPLAGYLSDRLGPQGVGRSGAGLATVAFLLLSLATTCSLNLQLLALAVGAVLFDLGVQASLIAQQTVIYRLEPAARSRLNAVLMVCMFIGMAIGSSLGSLLLDSYGWIGVTLLANITAFGALLLNFRKN